jgi:hypothetical protein
LPSNAENGQLTCGTTPPCEMTTSPSSLLNLTNCQKRLRLQNEDRLTLHRCGWPVADDEGQYGASCCPGRRYQRVQESQRLNIQGRQRGRLKNDSISLICKEEIFKQRRTRCAGAYTLSVVALLEKAVDTADGELETGF